MYGNDDMNWTEAEAMDIWDTDAGRLPTPDRLEALADKHISRWTHADMYTDGHRTVRDAVLAALREYADSPSPYAEQIARDYFELVDEHQELNDDHNEALRIIGQLVLDAVSE